MQMGGSPRACPCGIPGWTSTHQKPGQMQKPSKSAGAASLGGKTEHIRGLWRNRSLGQGSTSQVRNELWESGAGGLQHHKIILTPQLYTVKPWLKSDLSQSISHSHISQDCNFHLSAGRSLK